MRFDRGSWRKLFVAESVEHKLLSLFTRGLRDYLLRLAEDDGTILHKTVSPAADLALVLNAKASERKLMVDAIDDLIRIGYLSWDSGGRLWITKFEEAQTSRSPAARRQAAWREAHGRPPKKDSTDYGSIRRLRQIDGESCSYCGTGLDFRLGKSPHKATLDHVVPRTMDGSDGEDNLVLACTSCNSRKGQRTPEQAGLTLRNARVVALRGNVTNNVTNSTVQNSTEETRSPLPPADNDRETLCPPGLRLPEHAVEEIAAWAKRDPLVILEAANEFVGYWTIGGGAGKKRSHWLAKLRDDIRKKHHSGRLDEIESQLRRSDQAANDSEYPPPYDPAVNG